MPPVPTIVTIPAAEAPGAGAPVPPAASTVSPPTPASPGKPVTAATKPLRRVQKKTSEVDEMLAAVLADRSARGLARFTPPSAQAGKKAADETPPAPAAANSEPAAPAKNPVEDVSAALDDLQPKLKSCFRRFQIPGIAKVKLVVDPSGSIEPASLSGDFEGTPTGECVMQELSSATLPPFKGTPVQLNHAFVLR
jgi:hypothetical protein